MTLIYARCRGYRRHGGGSLSGSSKWGEAKACAWCLCGCLHVVDDAAVSVCVCVRERGGCGLLHRSVCSCVKPAARGRISGVIWVMIGWEWIDRRWPQRRASTDEFEREVWLCVCVNECRRSRRHTPTEVHEGACWWPRESRQQPTLRCTHTRMHALSSVHRVWKTPTGMHTLINPFLLLTFSTPLFPEVKPLRLLFSSLSSSSYGGHPQSCKLKTHTHFLSTPN